MTLPDNFAFRFGDMPSYTHLAQINDRGDYNITWDQEFYNIHGADWFECSTLEIERFVGEYLGWEIIEC